MILSIKSERQRRVEYGKRNQGSSGHESLGVWFNMGWYTCPDYRIGRIIEPLDVPSRIEPTITAKSMTDGFPVQAELRTELKDSELKICYQSRRDGNSELYVMDADGSNPVNITNTPDWDASGNKIAFVKRISREKTIDYQNTGLFVYDIHTGETEEITGARQKRLLAGNFITPMFHVGRQPIVGSLRLSTNMKNLVMISASVGLCSS